MAKICITGYSEQTMKGDRTFKAHSRYPPDLEPACLDTDRLFRQRHSRQDSIILLPSNLKPPMV